MKNKIEQIKLKTTITILFMVVISGCASSQSTEEKISKIRRNFKAIETAIKENNYTKQIKEFDKPDEDTYGTIEFYTEDNEVRKVVYQEIINEQNTQTTSYYSIEGKLFFAYHVSKAPRIINETDMELHIKERRYYYFEEHPIRCLEKYYMFDSNSEESETVLAQKTKNKEVDCNTALSVVEKYKAILKLRNE